MKFLKRLTAASLAALMLGGAAASVPLAISAEETAATYSGAAITEHMGGYDYGFSKRTLITHSYDFSLERIGHYASDPALALGSSTAKIEDGKLTTEGGNDFVFGSAVCLGDQYGLEEGYLSFDMKLASGSVKLGVRTSQTAAVSTDRGIWFSFDGSDSLKLTEPECGLEATLSLPVSTAEMQNFSLHDGLDTLTLSCGDTVLAIVQYTTEGYLAFCDATGAVMAETDKCELYPTGYFSLNLSDLNGYIDNLIFTNVEETWEIPEAESIRTIDYSTWTAHDALDRTVSDTPRRATPRRTATSVCSTSSAG